MKTETQDETAPFWCTDYKTLQRRKRIERLAEIGERLAELKILFDIRIKQKTGYEDIARQMESLRHEAANLSVASQP